MVAVLPVEEEFNVIADYGLGLHIGKSKIENPES
jgi:hypothetical protein